MANDEVEVIEFGFVKRITDQEVARIRGLHGLSPTPEAPSEPPVKAAPRKPARIRTSNDQDEPPLQAAVS